MKCDGQDLSLSVVDPCRQPDEGRDLWTSEVDTAKRASDNKGLQVDHLARSAWCPRVEIHSLNLGPWTDKSYHSIGAKNGIQMTGGEKVHQDVCVDAQLA